MKAWNGTAWLEHPAKVWDGTAWHAHPTKAWNGTAWVEHPAAGGGAWDPLTLPGLHAWWDWADVATITVDGTGQVLDTIDKRNGFHATRPPSNPAPVSGTRTINGLNVLDFEGQYAFLLTPKYMLTTPPLPAAAGYALYVVAVDEDPPVDPNRGRGAVLGGWSSGGLGTHFPWEDGTIYDGFGSPNRKTVGNPAPSLTTPHVYSVVSAPNHWRCYLDGVLLFQDLGNVVGWGDDACIGRANLTTGYALNGVVGEVLYGTVDLPDSDRQAAEAGLKAKWATP